MEEKRFIFETIGKVIGCTEPVIPKDLHAMIVHLPHLEKPQDFHMDANEFDTVVEDKREPIKGFGKGASAFFGLSKRNYMLILDPRNGNTTPQLITFPKRACLVLKYGTIHAGNSNETATPTYKTYTNISSTKLPGSTSQIWFRNGKYYGCKAPH